METNILPPTPQPCEGKERLIHNLFGEIKAFEPKLKFWRSQLRQYVLDLFPCLQSVLGDGESDLLMVNMLVKL